MFGRPLAIFRTADGSLGVLEDRCPHRNAALSSGRVEPDGIRCRYHGWCFAPDGTNTAIPGSDNAKPSARPAANKLTCAEEQGWIWAWGAVNETPNRPPPLLGMEVASNYIQVHRSLTAPGTVLTFAENALDVLHTSFLHGGWFRKDAGRKPIRCVVRRDSDRVECDYIGEQRPSGLVGRILAPGGGEVEHTDRFRLPSIVEVEYRIGRDAHIHTAAAVTPIDDANVAVHASVSLRTRIPSWILKPIALPIAMRIFQQDVDILAEQHRTQTQFGGAHHHHTDLDLLGPHIHSLLRNGPRETERHATERETTIWI